MTSSVQSLSSHSDDGGSDEQQKHPHSTAQHQQSAVTLPPGMVSSTTGFIVPPGHLDMAHTVPAPYPFVDPYYGSMIAGYQEGQPAVHPYFVGVHPGLPLPSETVEEPVYVNAKQYHGILRRRQSRAKAESENKLIKSRKPYLHESRHLHALKRARGSGGRFLTAKDEGKPKEGDPEKSENKSTGCSNSSAENEVQQSGQQSGGCSHDCSQSPAAPCSNRSPLNGASSWDKTQSVGCGNSDNLRLVRHRAS